MVVPRGFFVSTDDIFKQDSFSDPVWLDNAGIDQDVSRQSFIIVALLMIL
jgi:beta-xylosidase